ncbi:hypothetical protein NCCP691_07630 [Noviherbaspirillum aridicola]|uniref:Uncharacterized protein n=1 Tax=Noviherbaspirillum aridicola TaxID=2849687 RepID=A0ABQ4Q1X1_9BURK|nr:hypothetical protein NCCP691_07630 [Noviherbaspirillum aridicola]
MVGPASLPAWRRWRRSLRFFILRTAGVGAGTEAGTTWWAGARCGGAGVPAGLAEVAAVLHSSDGRRWCRHGGRHYLVGGGSLWWGGVPAGLAEVAAVIHSLDGRRWCRHGGRHYLVDGGSLW